jgi:hypothetical protein
MNKLGIKQSNIISDIMVGGGGGNRKVLSHINFRLEIFVFVCWAAGWK